MGLDAAAAADLRAVPARERTVLVLGNEGAGLRPEVREACTLLASIPAHDRNQGRSLNLSVAAGIALAHLAPRGG